jgi:membrane-bound lytic murein transglycosylase D
MKTHGNYLQKMKGWGVPYFNLIESVLQQYGLPNELKYIAVIESNLSTGATSNVGAEGPGNLCHIRPGITDLL